MVRTISAYYAAFKCSGFEDSTQEHADGDPSVALELCPWLPTSFILYPQRPDSASPSAKGAADATPSSFSAHLRAEKSRLARGRDERRHFLREHVSRCPQGRSPSEPLGTWRSCLLATDQNGVPLDAIAARAQQTRPEAISLNPPAGAAGAGWARGDLDRQELRRRQGVPARFPAAARAHRAMMA